MTKCKDESCSNEGQPRVFKRGDYQQPLGYWCDSCWAIIQGKGCELINTFDELKPVTGPQRAFLLVDEMIDQEAS